jgi:hypothetical protein
MPAYVTVFVCIIAADEQLYNTQVRCCLYGRLAKGDVSTLRDAVIRLASAAQLNTRTDLLCCWCDFAVLCVDDG